MSQTSFARTQMRRTSRDCSSLLALLTVGMIQGACSTSTEPDFSVAIRVDRFDPSAGELPAVTAIADRGRITVTGGIETPCLAGAGEIRASASLEGSVILLQIRWQPTRPCEPGGDAFVYEAQLSIVPPGIHSLTVTHAFPDEEGYVALEQTITVP